MPSPAEERIEPSPHAEPSEAVQSVLHEIDYQDVSISREAVGLITKAAKMVMDRYMPGSQPETLTASQAVAMFVDNVFWEERSGGLVVCAAVGETRYCLPIPKEHWSVRPHGPLH